MQLGRDFYLAEKPLGAQCGGEVGPEDFYRDLTVVLAVLGQVNGGHTTRTEFPIDGIAVGERGCEAIFGTSHSASSAIICFLLRDLWPYSLLSTA